MKVRLVCVLLIALSPVREALGASPGRIRNPTVSITPKVQYGTASWYGAKAQGRLMASGEPFDENALVAAHRTLPLGTTVIVTNLRNGLSVIVRIMDRGPMITSRIIDLSKAAAVAVRVCPLRPDNR